MFLEIVQPGAAAPCSPTDHTVPFHPCMDETAHGRISRLHLPVAPRCNIRCRYCQRRISSPQTAEACPGVTAAILSPTQAVEKTRAFLARWGHNAIVGIAGPGDPLANPETFETLTLIREAFPDARLCLCTNGLELPDAVDALATLGVAHLTITINGVLPVVAAQIHPWIRLGDRRIRGRVAAEGLITRQLSGLRAAVSRGIHVKINTVVIPGVNGDHVETVAREVAALGACTLNLIPLIPRGVWAERAAPSGCYLKRLKTKCRQYLPVFDRCQRCRADAEGIPGRKVAV